MSLLITLSVIVGLLLIVIWSTYNRLTKKRNQIENSISTTDALFIKRSNLIPNLISVAKQYANFEKETLEKVVALRGMNTQTPPSQEQEAQQALQNFMLQVERYPELKTNQQFLNLQYNMTEVEEQISAGRRYISSSITDYNNSVRTFPSNIVAKMTGFPPYQWQYAAQQQRQNIDASELFNK